MKSIIDERQAFLLKLRPLANGLFNAAHAITGNCELAEYVIQNAILTAYIERGEWRETLGFREGIMRVVRMRALDELAMREEIDFDWRGFTESLDSPVVAKLSQQPIEIQRAVMLRYGCGLSLKQAASVLDQPADALRDALNRCLFRLEKVHSPEGNRPFERTLSLELKRHLNRPGSAAFDPGTMMRTFEQDVERQRPRRRVLRTALRWLFMALGALIFGALFWILAILMEG